MASELESHKSQVETELEQVKEDLLTVNGTAEENEDDIVEQNIIAFELESGLSKVEKELRNYRKNHSEYHKNVFFCIFRAFKSPKKKARAG